MAKKINLSLVIPVHNEELILRDNCNRLHAYLRNCKLINGFEILLCNNGSTDKTSEIVSGISKKNPIFRVYSIPEKSLGKSILIGIKNSKYKYIMFYAIDLPFGTEVVGNSINAIKNCDVVVGSKGHKNSIIKRELSRKILTKMYNTIINSLFKLGISDTQGSLLFKKYKIKKIMKHLISPTPFLQTQILIYSKLHHHKIKEIPVKLYNAKRGSKINIIKSGLSMLNEIIKEFARIRLKNII